MSSINVHTSMVPKTDVREFKGIQIVPAIFYQREKYLLLKDLPSGVLKLAQAVGYPIYICGGALTSVFSDSKIHDYDFCFRGRNDLNLFAGQLDMFYKRVVSTPNAVSYEIEGVKIQLLRKRLGQCVDVINQFDFTICQAGYYFKEDQFIWVDSFLPHVAQRKLKYNVNHDTPINSLLRVLKFQKRGYSISSLEMIKIALNIQKSEINTAAELFDQMSGCSNPTGLEAFVNELKKDCPDKYEYNTFITDVLNKEIAYYNMVNSLKETADAKVAGMDLVEVDSLPF